MHTSYGTLAAVIVSSYAILCTANLGTNDQVNAPIDYGTFQNPSRDIRPKFRYWLPDASVNQSEVLNDLVDMASKGAGGVEFLGFYLYGGLNLYSYYGLAESDWTSMAHPNFDFNRECLT